MGKETKREYTLKQALEKAVDALLQASSQLAYAGMVSESRTALQAAEAAKQVLENAG